MSINYFHRRSLGGFTLIESLVGVAVFMIIAVSMYQVYNATLRVVRQARLKVTATALANEQMEIMRNLSFDDVGVVGSIPNGIVPHIQMLTRDGTDFTVTTIIRNIDDPFDGTIGGTPNDLAPSDYKLIEVEIACAACTTLQPISFTTYMGPRDLESSSTDGALFVKVLDANGQPVQGVNVHVENNNEVPAIVIDDTTNNNGELQIVGAPPGTEVYEITVSKEGYSSDRTYDKGGITPNPIHPHATVNVQQLTQISFAIDKLSTLNVASVTGTCAPVSSVDFTLTGTKIINTTPEVLKYDTTAFVTDGSGLVTIPDLEWDTYNLAFTDTTYDLAGTIPLLPFSLNPDTVQDVKLVVASKTPKSLLVTVKDSATQLPISGASVRLEKPPTFDTTYTTGRGFLTQTNWAGGSGQASFVDPTKYLSSDGTIEVNNPAGSIKLLESFGEYADSGTLTSSTFDTGSVSNFHQILWQPLSQPSQTGPNSVRFQIATNNDNATWNFKGPDGTAGSYYTSTSQDIHSSHNGNRYFRYKLFLQTEEEDWTPTISDVSFTFTSSCVPPGQVFFTGLGAGNHTLTVTKSGYTTYNGNVNLTADWQQATITLSP